MSKHLQIVSLRMVKEGSVPYSKQPITSAQSLFDLFRGIIGDADREACWIACLDTRHQITCISMISTGTLSASMVHPREVFKLAVLSNAKAIILLHNHPSGDTAPSGEDRLVTKRIKDAGAVMGIDMLDHIIIGESEFYSFADHGEVPL